MAFLTSAFPNYDLRFVVSSYDTYRDRKILADLPNLDVVPMIRWKRYIRGILLKTGLDLQFWTPRFSGSHFREADLFASVGGDIYTMFGDALPRDWLGYEYFASRHRIPSIMFGANMEKFEVLSTENLDLLLKHLQRFRMIAVRDRITLNYLADYGITENTIFFPDPIFSLRPRCTYCHGKVSTIGLNVTPFLLQNFGDSVFTHIAAVVSQLVEYGYRIRLLPHVIDSDENPKIDDRLSLRKLYSRLPAAAAPSVSIYEGPVSLDSITRQLSMIDLFIGARMHSCLNALTLGKPTMFLSYSQKAYTMVEWLQSGPMSSLRDRVVCVKADSLTLVDILNLIAAHERSTFVTDYDINFMPDMGESPIWKTMSLIL